MDKKTEERVIKLYLSGVGSTTIVKLLDGVTKRKVLKVLNDNKLIKPKPENNFYKEYFLDDGKWCGFRECPNCTTQIKHCANTKTILYRNIEKRAKAENWLCKKCSLDKQKGEGNPFYGKKHTIESITKMLSKQHKTLKPISKAEDEIYQTLINEGLNVSKQFIINGKPFDILLIDKNILIEYNGDYWHCNPNKYDGEYYHKKKGKLAKEIWEYDKNKIDSATKLGYKVITIWESDYLNDKNIIKQIINEKE